MAALQYDAPAADVLAAINARNLIDLATPEASLLLVNPLYETPPDHPNATFASIDSPYYQKWLSWIAAGALP